MSWAPVEQRLKLRELQDSALSEELFVGSPKSSQKANIRTLMEFGASGTYSYSKY
jgi:hypothetical protein